jgi:cytochrome c553
MPIKQQVNKMLKISYSLVLLLLVPAMSFAQQDVVAEDIGEVIDLQALIVKCEGCHGPNGNSIRDDIPSLAGKPVGEIEESITQFYYYERHCPGKTPEHDGNKGMPTDMCSIANSLSKMEIQALADHFSTQ